MAYLKIYCECGQKWSVYMQSMNDDISRRCPHCNAEIDSQTWRRQVVPALCQVADANRTLIDDHLGYGVSLFAFDVIEDQNFCKKGKHLSKIN